MNASGLQWFETTLGESFQTVTGNTPPKSNGDLYGDAIPFVKPPELNDGEVDSATDGLSEQGSKVARMAPAGSTLVSCIGNLGKIGLTTAAVAFNQQINAIFPAPSIAIPEFVYFLTLSPQFRGQLLAMSSGTTVPIVNKTRFNSIKVLLPALEEQKRIVAVLDQAFGALNRARTHAEANLADAPLLFEAGVDRLIGRARDDWRKGTFEQLVGDVFTGPFGSLLHKSDYIEGGTPIVNPSNIIDGRIEPDWTKSVADKAAAKLASYRLQTGDLVIGRRGEMGRCAPVLEPMEGWLCGTGSFVIRPRAGVSPEFVARVIRTPAMVEKLTDIATGATMPNLSNRALAQMPFALPPHETQLEMLEAIENLEVRTKALQSRLDLKLTDLTNLRQSLLQKAFAGKLT